MVEQCKGLTKAGNRCKITQGLVDGYCRRHKGQAADDGREHGRTENTGRIPQAEQERSLADDATELHRGLSTIVLVFTAILTFIFLWIFRKKKNKKKQ